MALKYEIRQQVKTVNDSWHVVVYEDYYGPGAKDEYQRLREVYPDAILQVVEVWHTECPVASTLDNAAAKPPHGGLD